MSQKFVKTRNNNPKSPVYGKYFAQPAYDENFVENEEIANFIQPQATVTRKTLSLNVYRVSFCTSKTTL